MGFESFWLQFNNGKKEQLGDTKSGVRKEQVDKKFHNLFDAYDTNQSGVLESGELEGIFNTLSVCAGSDKILDNIENKIITSIFETCTNVKDIDFQGFVKSISNASANIISSSETPMEDGGKEIVTEYADGTKETVGYYPNGNFKYKKTEKTVSETSYYIGIEGQQQKISKEDFELLLNEMNKKQDKSTSLDNNIPDPSFQEISTKTEERPVVKYDFSTKAKLDIQARDFLLSHFIETHYGTKDALDTMGILDDIGAAINAGAGEVWNACVNVYNKHFGNGTEKDYKTFYDLVKNFEPQYDKSLALETKLEGMQAEPEFYFKGFETDFENKTGNKYNLQKTIQFQQLAEQYQTATVLTIRMECLKRALQEVQAYQLSQNALTNDPARNEGINPAEHLLKAHEYLLQYFDNDKDAADLVLNGTIGNADKTLDAINSLIKDTKEQLDNTLLKKEINISETNDESFEIEENTLTENFTYEELKEQYQSSYKDMYGTDFVPDELTDKVMNAKATGGIVKIGAITIVSILITKSPAMANIMKASAGAAIDGASANFIRGLVSKYGQTVVQQGIKFAMSTGTLATDVGLTLLNQVTDNREGINGEEVWETTKGAAKYIYFGAFVGSPIAQAVTQKVGKLGITGKLFANGTKTTQGGVTKTSITGEQLVQNFTKASQSIVAKGAGFATDIAAFTLLDITTEDIAPDEALTSQAEMLTGLRIMHKAFEYMLGARTHTAMQKAKWDAAIEKSGVKNWNIDEIKTPTDDGKGFKVIYDVDFNGIPLGKMNDINAVITAMMGKVSETYQRMETETGSKPTTETAKVEIPLGQRLETASSREEFVAIRDEIKAMPAGTEKTTLQQEYLKKYNEFSRKYNEEFDIRMEYKPENAEQLASQTRLENFNFKSEETCNKILKDCGFSDTEIAAIKEHPAHNTFLVAIAYNEANRNELINCIREILKNPNEKFPEKELISDKSMERINDVIECIERSFPNAEVSQKSELLCELLMGKYETVVQKIDILNQSCSTIAENKLKINGIERVINIICQKESANISIKDCFSLVVKLNNEFDFTYFDTTRVFEEIQNQKDLDIRFAATERFKIDKYDELIKGLMEASTEEIEIYNNFYDKILNSTDFKDDLDKLLINTPFLHADDIKAKSEIFDIVSEKNILINAFKFIEKTTKNNKDQNIQIYNELRNLVENNDIKEKVNFEFYSKATETITKECQIKFVKELLNEHPAILKGKIISSCDFNNLIKMMTNEEQGAFLKYIILEKTSENKINTYEIIQILNNISDKESCIDMINLCKKIEQEGNQVSSINHLLNKYKNTPEAFSLALKKDLSIQEISNLVSKFKSTEAFAFYINNYEGIAKEYLSLLKEAKSLLQLDFVKKLAEIKVDINDYFIISSCNDLMGTIDCPEKIDFYINIIERGYDLRKIDIESARKLSAKIIKIINENNLLEYCNEKNTNEILDINDLLSFSDLAAETIAQKILNINIKNELQNCKTLDDILVLQKKCSSNGLPLLDVYFENKTHSIIERELSKCKTVEELNLFVEQCSQKSVHIPEYIYNERLYSIILPEIKACKTKQSLKTIQNKYRSKGIDIPDKIIEYFAKNPTLTATELQIKKGNNSEPGRFIRPEFNPQDPKYENNVTEVCNEIQNRLEKEMGVFSESQILDIAHNLSSKMQIPVDEVLEIMSRLTQFGSMKRLNNIATELDKYGISDFYSKSGISTNSVFKYFLTKEQMSFTLESIDGKKAFILDNAGLSYLEKLPQKEKLKFYQEIINGKIVLVELDGTNLKIGENYYSYTMLDGGQNLSAITEAALMQMQSGKNADNVLQSDIKQRLNNAFKEFHQSGNFADTYILSISSKETATAENIATQINPNIPDAKYIEKIIETVISDKPLTDKEKVIASSVIIKYFDYMAKEYSPDSFGELLKTKQEAIEQRVIQLGKTMDDVVYIYPTTNKSFDLVYLQYAKINNIEPDKIILYNGDRRMPELDGKVLVLLDDVVGSGASMISQQFGYKKFLSKQNNSHILFTPITCADGGKYYIETVIEQHSRRGHDYLVYDSSQDSNYNNFIKMLSPDEARIFSKIIGGTGYGSSGLVTGFPYMIPDNNSSLGGYFNLPILNNSTARSANKTSSSADAIGNILRDYLKTRP